MGKSTRRTVLLIALATLPFSTILQGQGAQVRATVSTSLPHYMPAAQLTAQVEVPGTDALSELGDEWNRLFVQYQPGSRLIYVPKLTKEAVKDLQDGTRPMIITARDMTTEELSAFQAKYGYMPMRIPVCLDATIVFVHQANPLSSITMEQLDAIYSKDRLGGAKAPVLLWSDLNVKGGLGKRSIQAYARAEGAATRDAFKTTVLLKGEYRQGILPRPDAASLAEAVVTDETGIAFGSMASWYAGVKVLPIVPYKATDARFPTQENVTSSRYPMPRLYYAYVNRAPGKPLDPGVNEVLHLILSQ